MDEAWSLGRGKYLEENGYENQGVIMRKHLARVCEIAKKYDFELLMWSDMFFRGWNKGVYNVEKQAIPEDYKSALPESVIPVYWNYYSVDEKVYVDMLYNHRQLSEKTWFAGGAWTWIGYGPANHFSITTMDAAISACKKEKTKNFFVTIWGDNGSECSKYAVLPSLFYIAEKLNGNDDEEKIKAKFKRKYGIAFDDFMVLDRLNDPYKCSTNHGHTTAKYMLFNDYFNTIFDQTVPDGANAIYAETAEKLHSIAKKTRKFAFLFDSAAKLCDVLSVKMEIGVKTRAAYKAGNMEELRRLANEEYTLIAKRLRIFKTAYEKQWTHDNTYNGFEVQDYRLGGLIERTESCKRRLLDYVNGKLPSIPELEYELLQVEGLEKGKTQYYNSFCLNVTGNVM